MNIFTLWNGNFKIIEHPDKCIIRTRISDTDAYSAKLEVIPKAAQASVKKFA